MLVPPAGNVVDLLTRDDRFSRLVELLRRVNLLDELASLGPITLFAPTNEVISFLSDVIAASFFEIAFPFPNHGQRVAMAIL